MSTARITIGGVEVSPHPSGTMGKQQRVAETQDASGTGRMFSQTDGERGSARLVLERPPWLIACPLPPAARRLAGALMLLGLVLALAVWLIGHRQNVR